MVYITVPDYNDNFSNVQIDNKEYLLRFTWNGSKERWSFGIYDTDKNAILAPVKIVPNWNLIHCYPAEELPDGMFGAICDNESIGRDDFKNNVAKFVYIPNSDLEE